MIISPSWAWAQALAALEWHHHLEGSSCLSLAWQKHFLQLHWACLFKHTAHEQCSLKFQQTLAPEFGRKLTSKS
jgi:hypothetical protein